MPNNFHIIDFKKDNFYDIFLNDYNSLDLISSNIRCQYLYQYLNRLNCKKIVLETKYIDKDYLMDYQDFYVRCFKPYSKICKRALFFSFDLNIRFINNIINSASNSNDINKLRSVKKIRENYLGFMVIKPLPEKVVGKTCIRTFDSDQGKRKYYVVRPYHSNFYGINLDVNSLAFQEQDKIMAACSTISLWSAFQKTSNVFNHYLPSPGEITRNATNNNLGLDRTIPSKGLEIEQIVESIRHVGLTFEIKRVNELEMNQFLGFIHAYLKIGLPIILILKIPNGFGKNDLHAVTITGYRLENKPIEKSFNEIDLISDRISELYVHDDQMGPFSRIYLEKIDKILSAILNHININLTR